MLSLARAHARGGMGRVVRAAGAAAARPGANTNNTASQFPTLLHRFQTRNITLAVCDARPLLEGARIGIMDYLEVEVEDRVVAALGRGAVASSNRLHDINRGNAWILGCEAAAGASGSAANEASSGVQTERDTPESASHGGSPCEQLLQPQSGSDASASGGTGLTHGELLGSIPTLSGFVSVLEKSVFDKLANAATASTGAPVSGDATAVQLSGLSVPSWEQLRKELLSDAQLRAHKRKARKARSSASSKHGVGMGGGAGGGPLHGSQPLQRDDASAGEGRNLIEPESATVSRDTRTRPAAPLLDTAQEDLDVADAKSSNAYLVHRGPFLFVGAVVGGESASVWRLREGKGLVIVADAVGADVD